MTPCFCCPALIVKHGPVIQVFQSGDSGHQGLSILSDFADNGVALQLENPEFRHLDKHLENIFVFKLVVRKIYNTEKGKTSR